jgi:hypothetical protein
MVDILYHILTKDLKPTYYLDLDKDTISLKHLFNLNIDITSHFLSPFTVNDTEKALLKIQRSNPHYKHLLYKEIENGNN